MSEALGRELSTVVGTVSSLWGACARVLRRSVPVTHPWCTAGRTTLHTIVPQNQTGVGICT